MQLLLPVAVSKRERERVKGCEIQEVNVKGSPVELAKRNNAPQLKQGQSPIDQKHSRSLSISSLTASHGFLVACGA